MQEMYSIDFMLEENEDRKLLFSFFPEESAMHGFADKAPKKFSEVYKVYYSWAIRQADNESFTGEPVWGKYEDVFAMHVDECSALLGIEDLLHDAAEEKPKELRVMSIGQPGSEWVVTYRNVEGYERFTIHVWNNYTDKGFRFSLPPLKFREFARYIRGINEYMLAHSVPC